MPLAQTAIMKIGELNQESTSTIEPVQRISDNEVLRMSHTLQSKSTKTGSKTAYGSKTLDMVS